MSTDPNTINNVAVNGYGSRNRSQRAAQVENSGILRFPSDMLALKREGRMKAMTLLAAGALAVLVQQASAETLVENSSETRFHWISRCLMLRSLPICRPAGCPTSRPKAQPRIVTCAAFLSTG